MKTNANTNIFVTLPGEFTDGQRILRVMNPPSVRAKIPIEARWLDGFYTDSFSRYANGEIIPPSRGAMDEAARVARLGRQEIVEDVAECCDVFWMEEFQVFVRVDNDRDDDEDRDRPSPE